MDEFGPARKRWEEVIVGDNLPLNFRGKIDLDYIHISAYVYPFGVADLGMCVDHRPGLLEHRTLRRNRARHPTKAPPLSEEE
jgi:hypothetical protein